MVPAFEQTEGEGRGARFARVGVPLVILAIIAVAIFLFARQQSGITRQINTVSTFLPVQPPPPPPPPPKPLETPKPVPQEIVQPTNTPPPPAPAAANDAITENAPAQDGTDAFNIGAGSGDGTRGSGGAGAFNRGAFNSYLSQAIQRAVRNDPDLSSKSFRVSLSVWLDASGRITRAVIRTPTGNDAVDQALPALLTGMPALSQAPPQAVLDTLPINLTIDLRKSL
jgi:periplasmic protein TonB